MARFNEDRDFGPILDAARLWGERCLVGNGSIFGDRELWTAENAAILRRDFVERPDLGSGGFLAKLQSQLIGSGPAANQLAAEMIWVLLLFQTNVTPRKKRENIETTWSWSGEPFPPSDLMSNDVLAGIGSAGQGYNTYRWKELALLIDITIAMKRLAFPARKALLDDPIGFGDWLAALPKDGYRQLPNLLRYLLFPDDHERISVADHKHRILSTIAPDLLPADEWNDLALDRALASLRTRLSRERGTGDFDFYDEDLKALWLHPRRPAWLLSWNPKNWYWDSLPADRERCALGGTARHSWRCHSTAPAVGDRAYLVRTGDRLRGVVARGTIARGSFEDAHYDPTSAGQGKRTRFVEVDFDDIRQAEIDPFVPADALADADADQQWSPQGSGIEIRPSAAAALDRLWDRLPPVHQAQSHTAAPFTLKDAMRGVFMPQAEFLRILSVWRTKQNIILQGAPGTGKTFMARRLAYHLIGEADSSRIETVQFHQSYGYEDFVQGYRATGAGFELRDGAFLSFCRKAAADADRPHVLIIDEINRGNLSKILGELMMLIEPDKRDETFGVRLAYAEPNDARFHVPRNVFIVGMMNTADRSLSLVDYALRRRFAFFTLDPQFGSPGFAAWLGMAGVDQATVAAIATRMTALNEVIAADTANLGRGFRIGHSFFTPSDGTTPGDDWFGRVVETEIRPLLEEYWFEQPAVADDWCRRLLAP